MMSAFIGGVLASMVFLLNSIAMAAGTLETRVMILPDQQMPNDDDPDWQSRPLTISHEGSFKTLFGLTRRYQV